ncbi:hypothetical protein GCM10023188_03420 [Pontibacter saemangeumensis]|uniref:ATP/ADP translocase n=1 Tax=Pontibacter saemangeumensis TaxID=1084525 RepID=A0ABP8L944_9BACT
MYRRINLLLNIKPSEAKLVGHLFLVQYFIGVATAFLFTSSLTLILSSYPVTVYPKIYILAAGFLFIANMLYSRLEARFAPEKLLQVIVAFSAGSILLHWACLTYIPSQWLPLFLAVWNMVVYMLVGYAFWGMAAILFNVRESKRLFSIVGAGDIPAKMLGYFSVTALVPLIGVVNLLWVSVLAFVVVDVLLRKFDFSSRLSVAHGPATHAQEQHASESPSFVRRFFQNRLILFIAFWSLLAYTIYSVIDFTFLSEIKRRYTTDHELATFISVFFAFGRLLAIGIKLLFSSRVIARLGLANCLLIAPLLLLLVNVFILLAGGPLESHLYAFGVMVLLSEILRSTLQEPVFFVLFQPLHPHSRLKGHLIAKGYPLPVALLFVGSFLALYFEYFDHEHIAIPFVSKVLLFMLLGWGASVFLVRNAYRRTLEGVISKGYFTGSTLFLNEQSVKDVLVQKAASQDPKVAIHALSLLEKADYADIDSLLLGQLQSGTYELREYVLFRVIANKMVSAVPLIKAKLEVEPDVEVKALMVKALYYLDSGILTTGVAALHNLGQKNKKAALAGLLHRKEAGADAIVAQELQRMTHSEANEDKLVAIDIIKEIQRGDHEQVLGTLLQDDDQAVFTRAMEAAGEVKELGLLAQVVQVGLARTAPAALQKSLLLYGDRIFGTAYIQRRAYPQALNPVLLKVASKSKGESATVFLEQLVQESSSDMTGIIDALWQKKAAVTTETQFLLKKQLKLQLKQSLLKATYYVHLKTNDALKPLQEAVCSEIHQDIQRLFKCLSLVYERRQIERVMELYNQPDSAKVYNAIEMLELIIPRKYFNSLNTLMELEQDTLKGQVVMHPTKELSVSGIIQEILTGNKAHFNNWTRSVACYMIPRLEEAHFAVGVLNKIEDQEDPLFQETRDYVMTLLN